MLSSSAQRISTATKPPARLSSTSLHGGGTLSVVVGVHTVSQPVSPRSDKGAYLYYISERRRTVLRQQPQPARILCCPAPKHVIRSSPSTSAMAAKTEELDFRDVKWKGNVLKDTATNGHPQRPCNDSAQNHPFKTSAANKLLNAILLPQVVEINFSTPTLEN